MRRIRVIPTLLLDRGGLVKTKKFKNPVYVGDPINALRIFNEKEVDELALLDISKDRFHKPMDIGLIEEIVSEAFMPMAFGGGIHSMERIEQLLKTGVEKVVLNTALKEGEALIRAASEQFGAQSIVASLDVRKSLLGRYNCYLNNGKEKWQGSIPSIATQLETWGVGEILLNAVDREGTYVGYDLQLTKTVSDAVSIPVIASGGASSLADFKKAKDHGASAVAAGSMFVFQRPNQAVLIQYPSQESLKKEVFLP